MAITIPTDGYCETTDVDILFAQKTLSATTKPTATQAETMITWWYHEINAMLKRVGYVVPMTTIASQLTAGSQLQVNAAAAVNAVLIELKDSGGSLTGAVLEGDLFLFAGDTQYYAAMGSADVGNDNLVTIEVSPTLRSAKAAGINVTHSANLQAANVLKRLNALCVAAEVERSTFSAAVNEESESNLVLEEQKDALWEGIESGRITLQGALRYKTVTPPGAARVERRG